MSFKKFLALNEALSDTQKKLIDTWHKEATDAAKDINPSSYSKFEGQLGHDQHDELFAKYNEGDTKAQRIIIPLRSKTSSIGAQPRGEVASYLNQKGWDHSQYHTGLASQQYVDKMGNQRTRTLSIGKILKDAPTHVKKAYETDPVLGGNKKMQVVISRHPYDIGGMSSGRPWNCTSCMRLPGKDASYPEKHEEFGHGEYEIEEGGAYHKSIQSDLLHGTMVAYLTKAGDDNVEKPFARTNLKKHLEFTRQAESTGRSVFRPEQKIYGDAQDDFLHTVHEFSTENWQPKPDHAYKKHGDLYSDSQTNFVTHSGNHVVSDEKGYQKYDMNQKLHTDDSSWEGASVRRTSGGLDTMAWHKNGEYHREGDLPAKVIMAEGTDPKNPDHYKENGTSLTGVRSFQFNREGVAHRDGDLPYSEQSLQGDYRLTEYAKYGNLHRDGDKPSVIETSPNSTKLQYHKFGVFHRDGDKPAEISSARGHKEETWMQYGQKHRDGDKPAYVLTSADNSENRLEWYKHGSLHRENGPALVHVTKFSQGDERTQAEWHRDGKPYRENGLPQYETHTKSPDRTTIEHRWTDGVDAHHVRTINNDGSTMSQSVVDGTSLIHRRSPTGQNMWTVSGVYGEDGNHTRLDIHSESDSGWRAMYDSKERNNKTYKTDYGGDSLGNITDTHHKFIKDVVEKHRPYITNSDHGQKLLDLVDMKKKEANE